MPTKNVLLGCLEHCEDCSWKKYRSGAFLAIRKLIDAMPEPEKPKVTREQARGLVLALETFCRESGIPTDRVKELNVPQVFLDILGLEVEEDN
jgi:hypothetical protein